ncbi:aquaporin [Bacteroidia bacterium]|nr:aquaporin [Bacteroidia bacterium]
MNYWRELLGEFIGTAILVFIGCGSVAIAVLYYPLELWHIALIWSYGVALAIYATNKYSASHLNPAVTFAMAFARKCKWQKVPLYFISQTAGAFVASLLILLIINKDLGAFEVSNGFTRGDKDSYQSAVMFGEFFPESVSHLTACLAEGLGTFTLVFIILILTNKPRIFDKIIPILIGLTVGAIIMIVAPYTQAGLNPARDFGPRLVAYCGGWGDAAFPRIEWSFFSVYILSPLSGGVFGFLSFFLLSKLNLQ